MKLNIPQFLSDYEKMTAIGKTEAGGCERLSMSDEDIAARKTLIQMLESEGMNPVNDEIAVIWGRIEGSDPDAAWYGVEFERALPMLYRRLGEA